MTADYKIYETLASNVPIITAIKFFIGDMEIKWFSDAIQRGGIRMTFKFEENGTTTKRVIVEFDIKCDDEEKSVIQKILYTDTSELGVWFADLIFYNIIK